MQLGQQWVLAWDIREGKPGVSEGSLASLVAEDQPEGWGGKRPQGLRRGHALCSHVSPITPRHTGTVERHWLRPLSPGKSGTQQQCLSQEPRAATRLP